jgi:hypothetical protein
MLFVFALAHVKQNGFPAVAFSSFASFSCIFENLKVDG